jgi:4-hydroxybenzoate polyprenyltransferase
MYVTPMTIGLQQHERPFGAGRWEFIVFFGIYCLAVIPLKDITDVAGDAAEGCQNWLALLGRRRLLAISAFGLVAALLVSWLLIPPKLGLFLGLLSGSTLLLVVAAFRSNRLMAVLYRAILLLVVVEGAALFVLWHLWSNGRSP